MHRQRGRSARSEPLTAGGRRATQSGPLRAAPGAAAVGIGAGDGGGDGFVAAARCSLSGGWWCGLAPHS